MPSFRDDHILIISPGSSQTLAQLGLPESYTPARFRFPSRMFRSIDSGKFTYTKYRTLREDETELLSADEVALLRQKGEQKEEKEKKRDVKDADGDTQIEAQTEGRANGKVEDEDEEMEDAEDAEGEEGDEDDEGEGEDGEGDGDDQDDQVEVISEDEEEEVGEEIVVIDEDESNAIWPIKEGRVVDWPAFFALLQHIHEYINPPFHTPLLLTCPPSWSRYDRELVTQFAFERLKVPGFCLLDTAAAITSAYGIATSTVIDVGFEKTDITPIVDFIPKELAARTINVGGETMTKHLQSLLPSWSRDEVEALKKSHICEILFPGTPSGDNAANDVQEEDGVTNVAAIVASGKTHEYLAKKEKEKQEARDKNAAAAKNLPNSEREKNSFWFVEKIKDYIEEAEDPPVVEITAEPVVVVQTSPIQVTAPPLEAEPASAVPAPAEAADVSMEAPAPAPIEPAAPAASDAVPASTEAVPSEAEPKPASPAAPTTEPAAAPVADGTLPIPAPSVAEPAPPASSDPPAQPSEPAPSNPAETDTAMGDAPPPASEEPAVTAPASSEPVPAPDPAAETAAAAAEEEARVAREDAKRKEKEKRKEEKRREGLAPDETRRQIEVGRERFKAAECGILSDLADAVYWSVSAVEEIGTRSELWNNLIVVGNGCRIRGFKEALLETLSQRYLISPSSATIFTSEIPSAASTPLPTGASTPQPYPGMPNLPMGGPGVNPLLVAATHSNLPHHMGGGGYPGQPMPYMQQQPMPGMASHHVSHSQTPSSIRMAKFPDYFPEWKEAGTEEAVFLGAQVHAKVVFVVDSGQGQSSRAFLSRVEYNEMGPGGIHAV